MTEIEKLDQYNEFNEFFIGKFEEKDKIKEEGETRFNKRKIIIKLI